MFARTLLVAGLAILFHSIAVAQSPKTEQHLDDQLHRDDHQPEAPPTVLPSEGVAQPGLEPELLEQELEQHQARERGHAVVVEAKLRDPVDTAMNFCSAGLHRKFVPVWSKSWCGNRSLDHPRPRSSGTSCRQACVVTQQRGRRWLCGWRCSWRARRTE